jgi:uncharacterized phiE125 gp8 family phage protein
MTIPLSQIKATLRIDFDDDDAALIRLRETALSLIERRTQLLLTPGTRTQYLASFKDAMLTGFPFLSLTSVVYYDQLNAATTMPATDYWLDLSEGSFPILRFSANPTIYKNTQPVVTYTAGYSVIPNEVTMAALCLIGYWYQNPNAADAVSISSAPLSLEYILDIISTRSMLR